MAICPFDEDKQHPVWIARALSDPNSNPEHPGCVLIQYFCPMSHVRAAKILYGVGFYYRFALEGGFHNRCSLGEHKLCIDCMEIYNKERDHTLCVENSAKAN